MERIRNGLNTLGLCSAIAPNAALYGSIRGECAANPLVAEHGIGGLRYHRDTKSGVGQASSLDKVLEIATNPRRLTCDTGGGYPTINLKLAIRSR